MSDSNFITDGIKKLLLASVGAVALTAEKSDEIIKSLIDKGEITVEQGKELNRELKRTVKDHREDKKPADMDEFVNGLREKELENLREALNRKDN
jgi:polyhydroxyalkanoate synthesis regulator phasin